MAVLPWTRCHFFALSPGSVCIAEVHGYKPGVCGQESAADMAMFSHPTTGLNRGKVKQVVVYEEFKAENKSVFWDMCWRRGAYGSGAFCCMDILRTLE